MDHDYEPGDTTSPMQTDPKCRICGEPKRGHKEVEEESEFLSNMW